MWTSERDDSQIYKNVIYKGVDIVSALRIRRLNDIHRRLDSNEKIIINVRYGISSVRKSIGQPTCILYTNTGKIGARAGYEDTDILLSSCFYDLINTLFQVELEHCNKDFVKKNKNQFVIVNRGLSQLYEKLPELGYKLEFIDSNKYILSKVV